MQSTNKANFMTEIDPVQFGKLINAVETLETNVTKLTHEVNELNQKISGGKGLMLGLVLTASGLGVGATKIVEALSK
jgi:hypothetical protein